MSGFLVVTASDRALAAYLAAVDAGRDAAVVSALLEVYQRVRRASFVGTSTSSPAADETVDGVVGTSTSSPVADGTVEGFVGTSSSSSTGDESTAGAGPSHTSAEYVEVALDAVEWLASRGGSAGGLAAAAGRASWVVRDERPDPPVRAGFRVYGGAWPRCGACKRRVQAGDAWRCPYVGCRVWLRGTGDGRAVGARRRPA